MNDSEIARSRWKLLSAAIKGQKSYTCNQNTGGSPLWSFIGALFHTRDISCDLKAEFTDNANCQHIRWLEYNPVTEFALQEGTKADDTRKQSIPSNSLQLRVYTSLTDQTSVMKTDPVKHRLNTLSGFDNTGNVHIWSSELLLAHAILCVSIYPGLSRFLSERFAPGSCQRICEVGAGMTGAAGLATCMIRMQPESVFHPLYVLLTDGNERCVESLQANLEHHVARFKPLLKTPFHMEARRITWKMDVRLSSSVKQRAIMTQVSPLITKMQWGSILVERLNENGSVVPDSEVSYRDAKLWPGGSRAWDWRETGTSHFPGIQTADVDELLAHDPDTIVLSQGVLQVLQVPKSTIDYIQKQRPQVQVLVHPSKKAFEVYNELASKGVRVTALIHTTC